MTMDVGGVLIDSISICGAIVYSVATVKVEEHGEESIVAGETEAPWNRMILETLLIPLDEDVA